jgi:hypothetical protein
MIETRTEYDDLTAARVEQGDTRRDELQAALARCMRFIRSIPDDSQEPARDGWRKELRAIKREIRI